MSQHVGIAGRAKPPGLHRDLIRSMGEPGFWAYSSWLEIVTRYRRTSLGVVWILLPPLAFMVVLGYVYAFLMGYPPARYLPYLGVGYALWRFIIQIMSDSSGILRAHKAFIFDGRARFTDYTLRVMSKALLYLVTAFIIVLGVFVWSSEVQVWRFATLLVTVPVFMLNMLWLSVLFAVAGARFPDVSDFMNTILIFAFLLTPILWFPEHAPGGTTFGLLIRFNPAFHLIELVRAPLMGYPLEVFSIAYLAVTTVGGWLLATLVYNRYARYIPFWL